MGEIKNKPEIRLKGYTANWECRELGVISDVYDGTHQTPKYTDSGVMFLSVENIKTLQSNKFISQEDFKDEFKVFPEKGDILMTRIGDIGTANVVESNEPLSYYVSLALLKKKDIDPYFLKESILSETVIKELWYRTLHIAFPKKINKNEIAKVPVHYPADKKEQTKIGTFFNHLDNLITLRQRKLDKLATLKISMLEKMFPKEGADVPEIRFSGFLDKWEKLQLSEILTERKILQKISDDAPILAFAAGQGVIDRSERKSNNRDHLTLDPANKIYLLTELNDIVYNPSNLKYGAIDRNKHGKGVISPIYVTFTTDEVPSFIELIVKSDKFKQRALQYEEGTVVKRQSVKPENLLSLVVQIPPSKDEQRKIGAFFEQLDSLIKLQMQELDKFTQINKFFLGKMFV